jgi:hypothetical protein
VIILLASVAGVAVSPYGANDGMWKVIAVGANWNEGGNGSDSRNTSIFGGQAKPVYRHLKRMM